MAGYFQAYMYKADSIVPATDMSVANLALFSLQSAVHYVCLWVERLPARPSRQCLWNKTAGFTGALRSFEKRETSPCSASYTYCKVHCDVRGNINGLVFDAVRHGANRKIVTVEEHSQFDAILLLGQ